MTVSSNKAGAESAASNPRTLKRVPASLLLSHSSRATVPPTKECGFNVVLMRSWTSRNDQPSLDSNNSPISVLIQQPGSERSSSELSAYDATGAGLDPRRDSYALMTGPCTVKNATDPFPRAMRS